MHSTSISNNTLSPEDKALQSVHTELDAIYVDLESDITETRSMLILFDLSDPVDFTNAICGSYMTALLKVDTEITIDMVASVRERARRDIIRLRSLLDIGDEED